MKAWPFLVSRNRSIGYTTIVAPEDWVVNGFADSLATIAGGEQTEVGTAICREVIGTELGDYTLVFRVIDAIEGEKRFHDGFGRLVEWIEGLVIHGKGNYKFIQWKDLVAAHDIVYSAYLDFWEHSVTPPIIGSKEINLSSLSSLESPKLSLTIRKVNPFSFTKAKNDEPSPKESSQWGSPKSPSFLEQGKTSQWNIAYQFDFKIPEELHFNRSFNEIVIVGGKYSYIGFFNPESKRFHKIKLLNETSTGALAVNHIGDYMAIGVNYKRLKHRPSEIVLWERKSQQNRQSLISAGLTHISCLAYNFDSSLLVCGTSNGDVFLWSKKDADFVGSPIKHKYGIKKASFTPDGKRLILLTEQNILFCKVKNDRLGDFQKISLQSKITAFAIHPSSESIAIGSAKSNIFFVDFSREHNEVSIHVNDTSINALAYSPYGNSLSIACNNKIHILDFKTKSLISTLNGHNKRIASMLFLADFSLFSAGYDNKIIVWSSTKE